MATPQIHRFSDGDVYFWIEQDTSIHLKALSGSDPVELTADDAKEIGEALIATARRLSELDSRK
jgi:hypothetical protein